MKLKLCPKCKQNLPLTSFTSTRAKFCNPCKLIHQLEQQKAMQQRAFERIKNKKQKKQTVIRISDLKKQVQRVFNKYIRLRDKDLPCISCQKRVESGDCGHYIAQGSSGFLRYNEDNCNFQCQGCNRFKHGDLINYRIGLIAKIGEKRVKWLEENRFKSHKWSREELENLLTTYQQKIKAMEWGQRNPHELKEMKANLEKSMDW